MRRRDHAREHDHGRADAHGRHHSGSDEPLQRLCDGAKERAEEKKRQAEPTVTLEGEVTGINKKLSMDKLRLDEHEKRLADLRNGLMASCAGVQALLEHELHNGNADEMQSASKEINTWLRERP